MSLDALEVPVTDTRQTDTKPQVKHEESPTKNTRTGLNLNVNVGLNSLNCSLKDKLKTDSFTDLESVGDLSLLEDIFSMDYDLDGVVGCSKFNVSDLGVVGSGSEPTRPAKKRSGEIKVNNVLGKARQTHEDGLVVGSANGLLTQFALDGEFINFLFVTFCCFTVHLAFINNIKRMFKKVNK